MKKGLLILLFSLTVLGFKAQIIVNPIIEVDSILKDKYPDSLITMIKADSVKYNLLRYYHKQSFILEKIACKDCKQPDFIRFDVSPFETLREQRTRYIRVYEKYGFKLTLLSLSELLYTIPIQN
jgi:hypothetical protein